MRSLGALLLAVMLLILAGLNAAVTANHGGGPLNWVAVVFCSGMALFQLGLAIKWSDDR